MKKTCKPTVAGILSIIAGVFTLIGFIALIIGGFATSSHAFFKGLVPDVNVAAICFGLSVLFLIIGVLAILGGVYALQRKRWGLALAGSILVIFTSFYLGVPATIFAAISKDEFE